VRGSNPICTAGGASAFDKRKSSAYGSRGQNQSEISQLQDRCVWKVSLGGD